MLQVGANLATFRLGAGEPFLLELAFEDRQGARIALAGRAYVTSVFTDTRDVLGQIEGAPLADAGGDFVRFAEDGDLAESLYGRVGLRVEIAEEFRHGREVIATGSLTIATSAGDVPSLGDDAPIGDSAVRVTVRQVLGQLTRFRIETVSYSPAPVALTIATTLGNSGAIGAAIADFPAPAAALDERLTALGV